MKKIEVNALFKSEESITAFIIQSILTYRLNEESVFELFDIEKIYGVKKEDFNKFLLSRFGYIIEALNYALYIEKNDQEQCKRNCTKTFYLLALSKNNELYHEIWSELTDDLALSYIKKGYSQTTDEEFLEIIKYQLKYSLSSTYMAGEVDVARSTYQKRIANILVNYPELERRYKKLGDFYQDLYLQHRGTGR